MIDADVLSKWSSVDFQFAAAPKQTVRLPLPISGRQHFGSGLSVTLMVTSEILYGRYVCSSTWYAHEVGGRFPQSPSNHSHACEVLNSSTALTIFNHLV